MDFQCLSCRSNVEVVMDPIETRFASAFRDSNQKIVEGSGYFGWGHCTNCYLFQNLPLRKELFSTRYHEWIQYNEPDWHFDNILSEIKKMDILSNDYQYVIGLSYKDTSLVEEISREFGIKAYPSDFIGITNDWYNLELNEAKKKLSNYLNSISNGEKVIIIARRIFDHCTYPIEFLSFFNCLLEDSLIYLEMNDYKQLFSNNIYDFFWNERAFYPFSNHVENIINKASLHPISTNSICTNSESIFYSFAQINQNIYNSKITRSNPNSIDINFLKNYVHNWQVLKDNWDSVCLKEKLGIVGASHKGISFSQLFLNNLEYYLFDDSLNKKGKYHPDRNILVNPINSLSIKQVSRLIVTVSEKWHGKLKSQFQSINSKAKLYTFEGIQI